MSTHNDYREWTDERVGLRYAEQDNLVTYWPCAPFYVDGIRYDPHANTGPIHRRPMLQGLPADYVSDARMVFSDQLTEADLDEYVYTGYLRGRRMR